MPQEPEPTFFPSKEEQVRSYLILEDSDDQEHLSDDCSSLDFSDDELYDECVFSSSLPLEETSSSKGREDDADEEEEEDDDDDDVDEDILMNTFFGDFYLEDDIQLYVPGDEGPSFVTNENVDMIRNLTSQLKNKRETNMLKLAAHVDASMLTFETSESTRGSDSSPDLKNAFYKDCAPFELPADFTPYAGVVPASIHTPMGTSDESASEDSDIQDGDEEDDEDEDENGTSSSSDSSSEDDSDTSGIVEGSKDSGSDLMKGSESDVDVEEVDVEVTSLTSLTSPRQNKRRFIEEEEEDDDSDDENLMLISSRLSLVRSVSAPVTPNPPRRGRPPQQQPRSLRKTANNSPATSRPASRSSSPVPSPSPRSVVRKPTQLESSLIFKMRHLLPVAKRPEVFRFIEKAIGSPFKGSLDADADFGEDLLSEFAPLAPSKLQEISNFVQQCIQAKTAVEEETILRQESLKQEASTTPTKQEAAPSVHEALQQETPPPSTPQPARQTRSRREAASSRSPSDSPLNNATPKPLPTSYVARPTSRTKSAGAAFKKQKADNGSDDEIDVLGF